MRKAAASVIALAAAADAFAPTGVPVPRHSRHGAPCMTLAPPESPAVPEARLPLNLAKERALEANREQWGITESLNTWTNKETAVRESAERAFAKPPAGTQAYPAAGVPGYRVVTNDEVRAVAAKLGEASREEAEASLATLGYEGALLEAVWKGVEDARAGRLSPAPGDEAMEEARKLKERSIASLAKAAKLEQDAAAAEERARSELGARVRVLQGKLAEAEKTAGAWAWNPFSTAQKEAEDLAAQVEEAKSAAEALSAEAAEGLAGAAAMRAASANEAEAATAKVAEARALRLASSTAARDKAVAALQAELSKWEAMGEGAGAAASLTPAALQLLADAGVQPSARAGLNSLAGRVAKVRVGEEPTTLLCETLQPKGGKASDQGGVEAAPEALMGAVVAAAAAGIGYAVSQGYIQLGVSAAGGGGN